MANTVPNAPIDVQANGGVQQAEVTWYVPDNGGQPISAFVITPSWGSFVQPAITIPVGPNGGPLDADPSAWDRFTVNGLNIAGEYTFSIACQNSVGVGPSSTSNAVPILPPPILKAPTGVVVTLPHLRAQPFIDHSGAWCWRQQNTLDEVSDCVEVICGTIMGQRTMVPTFGLPDEAFSEPNANQIVGIINKWEPRAAVTVDVTWPEGDGSATVNVKTSLLNQGFWE